MGISMQILTGIALGLKRNWHIFLGIILGLITGIFLHSHPSAFVSNILIFIGKFFIRLLQMVVIPLVVSAIVIGVTSVGDNKQLGKFGKKMVIYYGIISLAAVTIGSTLALIFKPGLGAASYIAHNTAVEVQTSVAAAMAEQQGNLLNNFLEFIPSNAIHSFAAGDMVPIIVFVLLFSIALAKVGEVNRPIVSFFESIFAATMKITDWIMVFAAPGVFALTASSVSNFGMDIFVSISKYFLVLLLGFMIQLCAVYPIFLKLFSKVNIGILYSAVAEAMLVAFGTASSAATLPLTMACCEKRGISHRIARLVLPLGATLNMDGTALLQTVAVIFLAQAYGIALSPFLVIKIALLAIIASSTCAGITGGNLITIALILNGMGLSPEQLTIGFAFLYTIERITDMMGTMVSVTSDAVVVAAIADNENEIDYKLLNHPEAYQDIT